MCNVIFEQFPNAELLAGVATAGIAWGAMAADQLKLPFVYVRPKPKEHGLGNQVEGFFEAGQKAVVVEDLISTGKSSLQVVDVLRNAVWKLSAWFRFLIMVLMLHRKPLKKPVWNWNR
jgi:orotate phosphoribosyltransferase